MAMETFMTELSRDMRNCAAASVSRTTCPPAEGRGPALSVSVTVALLPSAATWVAMLKGTGLNAARHAGRDAGI